MRDDESAIGMVEFVIVILAVVMIALLFGVGT